MNDQKLDILAINETRLDSDFPKGLVSVQGYTWVSNNINSFGYQFILFRKFTALTFTFIDNTLHTQNIFFSPTLKCF